MAPPDSRVPVLEALIASSRVVCAYWDAEQESWQLTPGFGEALGLAPEWLAWNDMDWDRRVHADDGAAFTGDMQRFAGGANLPPGEVRLRHENGIWRWFRYRGAEHGRHRFACFEDDTEVRQERAALVDSQLRLRSIYDLAPVAIVVWSREGRITDWNHAAEGVFGYATGEVIGTKLAPLLIAPIDYERFSVSIATSVKEHAPRPVICRSLTKAGEEIVCDWRTVPLRGPKGALQGLLSLALDVTATVSAEAALCRSRDQAEALSRAKSEFLAVIGHELRTPLNGVLGMAQLLELAVSEPEQEYVQAIIKSGQGLLAIINGIVDYTEIDIRSREASIEEIVPGESLAMIAERHGFAARRKGIGFRIEADDRVGEPLLGDRRCFEKVIDVLLDNAVKFTETGAVSVSLASEGEDAAGVTIGCTVADTGVGIPPEYIDRLYIPFSQVEGAIVRRFGGVGLGLALAKKLVDRMAGTLSVESRVGAGTTFVVKVRLERCGSGNSAR